VGQLRRVAVTFGTIVIATAFYWLPLAISIAGADHPASQANRWFSDPGALPQLPFLDPTPTGLLALIGLAYLVLTARADVLSRALLIFLAGGFAWYLLGWPAAALGAPLLTFRGGPIIELILLTAGVLGLVRMAQIAAARVDATQVRLVASLAAILLVLYAGRSFMLTARLDPTMAVARSEPLPDGTIPRYGMAATKGFVSERTVQQAIESRYSGPGHPVVLSTRPDLLAVSPYYGFVQWQVYYSHPAAEFEDRIAFLRQLAASATSQDLARRAADNAFDKIDAFVLQAHGPNLSFDFRDDNFPSGTKGGTVTFARSLFDSPAFDVVDLGSFVVVVRH
jgi:hypothetical protein